MRFGIQLLAVGVVATVALVAAGVRPGWRALAFLPFWLGGIGVFQARDRT